MSANCFSFPHTPYCVFAPRVVPTGTLPFPRTPRLYPPNENSWYRCWSVIRWRLGLDRGTCMGHGSIPADGDLREDSQSKSPESSDLYERRFQFWRIAFYRHLDDRSTAGPIIDKGAFYRAQPGKGVPTWVSRSAPHVRRHVSRKTTWNDIRPTSRCRSSLTRHRS